VKLWNFDTWDPSGCIDGNPRASQKGLDDEFLALDSLDFLDFATMFQMFHLHEKNQNATVMAIYQL
jgi:hypothetical protein